MFKKSAIIIILCQFASLLCYGQNSYASQWVLDKSIHLDFRGDSLILDKFPVQNFGSGDFCNSICNEVGDLLFYSGGCNIIDSEHELMINGDSINSEYAFIDFCNEGDYPFPQSNLILPYPLSDSLYYYFNLDINILDNTFPAPLNLLYHIIDISKNNGKGEVILKNATAISDSLSRGYLQAVRHSNNIDWWIVAPKLKSNCYYITLFTSSGLEEPVLQCIGEEWSFSDGGGQAVFSPDRTKYARIEAGNGWYLFDFDNENGILSNEIQLSNSEIENYFRGVAFSPNSRFLYVTGRLDLFQFDLESTNIKNSKLLVGQLDPSNVPSGAGSLSLQQLAPDNRIYISSPGSHKYLSIVENPNCLGVHCDFKPWAIELPAKNYGGIPNMPHFGNVVNNTPCDTMVSNNNEVRILNKIWAYPNPSSGSFFINSETAMSNVNLKIYSLQGVLLYKDFIKYFDKEQLFFDSMPGTYILKIEDNHQVLFQKILINRDN